MHCQKYFLQKSRFNIRKRKKAYAPNVFYPETLQSSADLKLCFRLQPNLVNILFSIKMKEEEKIKAINSQNFCRKSASVTGINNAGEDAALAAGEAGGS